jgi:hypothetical protein
MDISQKIKELEELANKPHRTHDAFENGIDAGSQKVAKDALEVIFALRTLLEAATNLKQ